MTLEFQENVVRYLLQVRKDGKKFIPLLEDKIFDDAALSICFKLIQNYLKSYNTLPTNPTNLIEFFERSISKNKKADDDSKKVITTKLKVLFNPLSDDDTPILKETILHYAKAKLTKNLFRDYAGNLSDVADKNLFDGFEKDVRKILKLDSTDRVAGRESTFLIKDRKIDKVTQQHDEKVIRARFPSMNKIMGMKGFSAPELIVIMAGPKAGKTTLLVNLAVDFIQKGLKVAYIDTENGKKRIRNLSKQIIMEATSDEMYGEDSEDFDKEYEQVMKSYERLGGELLIEYFPPKRHSSADVKDRLLELEDETGFIPDVLIVDYLDNFTCEDPTIKEKRLKLQEVYMDFKVLNSELGVPTFSVSQVNRAAVEKAVFTMSDIAEDFGKVANADSIWAYCSTPGEKANGYYRLVPVANRGGRDMSNSDMQAKVKINWDTFLIDEMVY